MKTRTSWNRKLQQIFSYSPTSDTEKSFSVGVYPRNRLFFKKKRQSQQLYMHNDKIYSDSWLTRLSKTKKMENEHTMKIKSQKLIMVVFSQPKIFTKCTRLNYWKKNSSTENTLRKFQFSLFENPEIFYHILPYSTIFYQVQKVRKAQMLNLRVVGMKCRFTKMSFLIHSTKAAFGVLNKNKKQKLKKKTWAQVFRRKTLEKKVKNSLSGNLNSLVFIEKLTLSIAKTTKFPVDWINFKLQETVVSYIEELTINFFF